MTFRSIAGAATWVLAMTALPASTLASPEAEALDSEAMVLMESGSFAEACSKLARSSEIDPTAPRRLRLGECHARAGQAASAWRAFRAAAELARAAGQADLEQQATEEIQKIEGRLSRLTIAVAEGASEPGLVVSLDGVPIATDLLGTAMPVDPGSHRTEASAPGKLPWSQTVEVGPDGATATVTVPALTAEAPVLPAAAPPGPPPVAPKPPPPPAPDTGIQPQPDGTQRIIGIVVGAVGVAGLAGGTVFGLQAKSKERESEDHCSPDDPTLCHPAGLDLLDRAATYATLSNVSFIVGGAALAAGAVLVLTAPSTAQPRPEVSLRIAPALGVGRQGLLIQGRF